MPPDPDTARKRLLDRRSELENLRMLDKGARDTVTLDQQSVGRLSRMDALQQQAMAQATERQRLAELSRIELTLRLIEEDEYGYCAKCGEEIPEARLEIDPTATQCIGCASQK